MSVAAVVGDYWRRPAVLARALVAVGVAAAHARTIHAQRLDHIHAHFATYPALAAWFIARLTGVPYSFTAHAHDLFVYQEGLARKVDGAAFVVAISEFNRNFLADEVGATTPVHVVRCGVIPERYERKVAQIPEHGPVRGACVAGLRDYKGHRYLLEALAGPDRELARVRVDLVGTGPLESELRQLVTRLGLGDRVRFLGGMSEDDVVQVLEAADFFVLPSIVAADGNTEGVPVALMEALAAGVPAIATRVSGVPELVRPGETGLLAEPGDAGDLRRRILELLADPDAAVVRAVAGRELVAAQFDVERSARQLAALFSSEAIVPARS